MNDRMNSRPGTSAAETPAPPDPTLPPTTRLGAFEIERLIARSASTAVYLATDHALAMRVAIQEYLPARMVQRDAGLHLRAVDAWQHDVIARGLHAFIEETRLLAHCDHPSLVRVFQLFEGWGSAYRVMPVYTGPRLSDVRRESVEAPDEPALRTLLEGLLGAVDAVHRSGCVHGGVSPSNILMLADGRPLLLGAGTAGQEIGSDLVDSLMATLETSTALRQAGGAGAPPTGAALDLYMLADTLRFCMTGEPPAAHGTLRLREPLGDTIQREFAADARPGYSPALLGTLDAALSPFAEDRPLTAAQFGDWLRRGVPGGKVRVPPAPTAAFSSAFSSASSSSVPPGPSAWSKPPIPAPSIEPAATTQPQPRRPLPPLFDASLPPLIEPITPERPPWVTPPELQRIVAPRRRGPKMAMIAAGVAAAAVAVGVLTVVTGAWNLPPEIRLESAASRSGLTLPAPPAPVANANAPLDEKEEIIDEPAPVAAAQASAPFSSPSLPRSPTSAPDPAAILENRVPTAAELPVATQRPERRSAASSLAGSDAGGPRAACAGRTEFALYRCVLQQCQYKRWTQHPQCEKLRREDRVD